MAAEKPLRGFCLCCGHTAAFFVYAQGRTDEIVAYETCAPRGGQGEILPYSILCAGLCCAEHI